MGHRTVVFQIVHFRVETWKLKFKPNVYGPKCYNWLKLLNKKASGGSGGGDRPSPPPVI